MNENSFRNWLRNKYDAHTISSRISNCRRVEEFEGDLDKHYANDMGHSLLLKLTYSKDDQEFNIMPKHRIPIDGNRYTGTGTFKSAVKLYYRYLSDKSITTQTACTQFPKVNHTSNIHTVFNVSHDWPVWEKPNDDEIYLIISTVLRYVKFLNPDIVEKITDDNKIHGEEWRYFLKKNDIDPEIYLWDMSPCAFPGIRRHAGSKEITEYKNKIVTTSVKIQDALCLDDNSFPKEIWSFIFRGKKFQNSGPDGYALAHLADHKDYKNRAFTDFKVLEENKANKFYGLFTCPSNTVFIPTSLIRPTDFSPQIRRILIYKAFELYGNFCRILPPWIELEPEREGKWHHKNFNWANTVGTTDNLVDFLKFRNKIMTNFMNK